MAEEFSSKQLEQLAEQMRTVFNEGVDALVTPQFDKVLDRLDKAEETQSDQGQQLNRIEQSQQSDRALADYHDQEIERLLKHNKLEPLPLKQ